MEYLWDFTWTLTSDLDMRIFTQLGNMPTSLIKSINWTELNFVCKCYDQAIQGIWDRFVETCLVTVTNFRVTLYWENPLIWDNCRSWTAEGAITQELVDVMAILDKGRGGYRVFVGDLGSRVGKYDLERECQSYGPILDVWVARCVISNALFIFLPAWFCHVYI